MTQSNQMFLQHEKIVCRVAIYARYSSDRQSPQSADDQIRRLQYEVERGNIKSLKCPSDFYRMEIAEEWVESI